MSSENPGTSAKSLPLPCGLQPALLGACAAVSITWRKGLELGVRLAAWSWASEFLIFTQGLWKLPDKVVWSKCPAIWFSINTLSISETNGESWVQSMYPRKEALLPFLYPHGELCLRTSGPGWEAFSLLSLWDGSLKPRKQKDKINHKQTMFWRQFLNKQKSKPVLPLCWPGHCVPSPLHFYLTPISSA